MSWIQHPVILEGKRVRLIPLVRDHFNCLQHIGEQPSIWEFMSMDGSDTGWLTRHLQVAVLKRATGEQYPFTVIDKLTGSIIGSTMFHNIMPEHRKLEIGCTWLEPAYWRTGYNRECKLLLLSYCFDALKTIRVQFATDDNNHRSRAAILGIGATFEGILRNERMWPDGSYRNTVMYSIVEHEWPGICKMLEEGLSVVKFS